MRPGPSRAASHAVFAAIAAIAALPLAGCRLPWQPEERACADRARLDLPLDASAATGSLWPFGAHGAPHPEGHPGIDFLIEPPAGAGPVEVRASYSAEILSITPESGNGGGSCIVLDSACVEVNLCHVVLDPALKAGGRVMRGQVLGTVAPAADGRRSLHFGTYSGPDAAPVCPADFLDPDTVECLLGLAAGGTVPGRCGFPEGAKTWMGGSDYAERAARTLTVACENGSSQTFVLPAENALCNARLPAADRARMEACLGEACAGVW